MQEPSSPGASADVLDRLDDALVRTHRLFLEQAFRRRISKVLDDPVPVGSMRTMFAIDRASTSGGPTVGDLAQALGIDPSTASRAAEDAVVRGLAERSACRDDRRRQRLLLTDRGSRLLDRVRQERREMLREVTAQWDEGEITVLLAQLERLVAGYVELWAET